MYVMYQGMMNVMHVVLPLFRERRRGEKRIASLMQSGKEK
jgi:hypothetical protein